MHAGIIHLDYLGFHRKSDPDSFPDLKLGVGMSGNLLRLEEHGIDGGPKWFMVGGFWESQGSKPPLPEEYDSLRIQPPVKLFVLPYE